MDVNVNRQPTYKISILANAAEMISLQEIVTMVLGVASPDKLVGERRAVATKLKSCLDEAVFSDIARE